MPYARIPSNYRESSVQKVNHFSPCLYSLFPGEDCCSGGLQRPEGEGVWLDSPAEEAG